MNAKHKKTVVCKGCAFLVLIKGFPSVCLHGACFIDGALQKKVDMKGSVVAEKKNKQNRCPHKKSLSLRALELKGWVKKDCERKGIKIVSFKEYWKKEDSKKEK
jgi:hypothetical protein